MNALGWLRETVNFPTPQSQSDTVIVPGRNSPIRFTEALGRVSYQPRSFELTFSMLGTRAAFNQMVNEIANRFSGHLVQVICSEEPELFIVGTVEAAPTYDPLTAKGQLVLSCTDGDAYRYHVYLTSIKPMQSVIVCKKNDETVFEGRALDDGSDFYNTHTWTCESCLAYLKDTVQQPYSYKGTLRGLLEYFISVHNGAVEDKKKFTVGNVTVTDDNDYISYSSSGFTVTLDAIRDKLIKTHGGYLRVRYTDNGKVLDYLG